MFGLTIKQRYINKRFVMTIEEIKEKIQYGDYITLSKMFKMPTATVIRKSRKTTRFSN
jgi:hypothetical protein